MTKIVNIGDYIENLTKKIEEMSKTFGDADPAVETLAVLRDSLMNLPEIESLKESYAIFLCGEWICTYCGHEEKILQNYCPECGRKLKGEKRKNDITGENPGIGLGSSDSRNAKPDEQLGK